MSADIMSEQNFLFVTLYKLVGEEKTLMETYCIKDEPMENFHVEYLRYAFSGHFEKNTKMILEISAGDGANIYLDDMQLEKGLIANTRNIVENSNFSNGTTGWETDNEGYEIVTLESGEKAFKINNNPNKSYSLSQKLKINGKEGESYRLSFWYKHEGVIKEPYEIEGVLVSLALFPVDPEDNGMCIPLTGLNCNSKEWQYYSCTFTAAFDYTDSYLTILCLQEANAIYFTDFMIIKDPREISYDYDKEGNLISSTGLDKEKNILNYDKNNQLISSFNPKGNNYKYEYDNIKTDRVLKGISPTGISNEIKYDNNGNAVKTIINNVNPDEYIKDNGNYLIRLKGTDKYLSCNYSDNLISFKEENCNKQYIKVTKVGDYYRLKIGYKNLTVSNDTVILSSLENDSTLFTISMNDNGSYNIIPKTDSFKKLGNKNNQLSIITKEEDNGNNSFHFEDIDTPLYIENKSYYTPDGRFITCVVDSLGKATNYVIDENTGLVKSITNPQGIETTTNYDTKGRPINITNINKTVEYEYNTQNMLSKIKSGTKEYNLTYDNFLNTKTISIGNTKLIENEYDTKSSLLKKSTYGNNSVVSYTYDELERLKTLSQNNKVFTYHYDNFGNLGKIISDDEKYAYNYNIARKLTSYINNEFRIDLDYDKNGNVISKNYLINDVIKNKISYEYNKDDSIIKVILDNNNINYNYDYLGRLKSKNINNNLNTEYTYITNGNKTSLVLNTMKIDNDLYKYSYDELYNITHIYLNNELINEYTYDDINELLEDKNYKLNKLYKFTYDTEGNIQKKQEYELSTHILLKEDTYEYNNPNWEDQLTKFNNESITYDNIGNPLTIGNANLTWINGRQLNTYTKDNLNVSYTYDINGIRTSKTINGITTNYYVEGNHIVFEKTRTNMIYYIRDKNGELIGLKHNSNTYFYKKNYQGDIIGIYDNNYNIVVNYEYDSWGNIISIINNNGNEITDQTNIGIINPYRYRSYYYDTKTKLYYLNSRYYNPEWGRFINSDKVINNNILGANLYAYCENNFISKTDVDGLASAIVLGIIAITNGAISAISKLTSNIASGEKPNKGILGSFSGGGVSALVGANIGGGFFGSSISGMAGTTTEAIMNELYSYSPIHAKLNGETEPKTIKKNNLKNSVNNIMNEIKTNAPTSIFSNYVSNKVINSENQILASLLQTSFGGLISFAISHIPSNQETEEQKRLREEFIKSREEIFPVRKIELYRQWN